MKIPSTQSDADIDIPLPPMLPPDGVGIIWTKDGSSHFDFFPLRIELARIQGKVYDLLFSSRSFKVQDSERKARVSGLQKMLDQWYERIPTPFGIEKVAETVGDLELRQMTIMYHTYLLCLITTHGIYSSAAQWQHKVSSLSRAAIQDFGEAVQGSKVVTSCSQSQHPPLEEGWDYCVDVSRATMKLFQNATPTDCLLW